MKNKVIWAVALSILIFVGFMGMMCQLKDNGIFYIKDIEGQRDYLNLFPIEGVTGDSTHGMIFRLEEGELSTKFYSLDSQQINNLLLAEREGVTGIKKYSYDYFNERFRKEPFVSTDSAPSKDAKIQHREGIYEEALEDIDLRGSEFMGGETVFADKVDVYLYINRMDNKGDARVRTGITLQNQEGSYFYTRGDYEDGTTAFHQSFYDIGWQIEAISIKMRDSYYCMAIPNRECKGETSLFRIKEDGMRMNEEPDYNVKSLYEQGEYGKAEVLCSFPVDQDNRVLEMFAVGDQSIGIFRAQGESLIFEIYDTQGNIIAQDFLTEEMGGKVDEVEVDVIAWNENDVSIYVRTYQVFKESENAERWDGVVFGMYQVDEKGLKRLQCLDGQGGELLKVCRNNLVLDVFMDDYDGIWLPYHYRYQVGVRVMNGDTGKILYQGRFETDYNEDQYKLFSPYNIAKKAPYLEESMKNYLGGIISQRQRQIIKVLPIGGKVESIWWR